MARDYYEILGVERNANDADIKKAYRRLAMKYHPDRNPDDADAENKFKEAQAAYEILKDAEKRAAYDRFGHAGVNQGQGGASGFQGGFGFDVGDIFGDIFGGGGRRRQQRQQDSRGGDLQYHLDVTLEEAVSGAEVKIRVDKNDTCGTCNGSGARPGTQAKTCERCAGTGQIRMQQGFFSLQTTCNVCRGSGKVIASPCGECSGQGIVRKQKTLSVRVPAGINTGDRVRLPGEGEPGAGGKNNGDLYVKINIKPHDIFVREGDNLYCDAPVDIVTAALGGEIMVQTMSSKVKLRIPPGTQSGKVFRLPKHGVKHVRSQAMGDLFCRVHVSTPVNLNDKQKTLLREFGAQLGDVNQQPAKRSWVDGVKDFFTGGKDDE